MRSFELRDAAVRLAECLQYFGIRSGDKVGICAENCFEFAHVLFGTFMVGATFAPMNVTYTERNNLTSFDQFMFVLINFYKTFR